MADFMLLNGMNTILASGLLNIGKEIIRANLPGMKSSEVSKSDPNFSQHLKEAQGKPADNFPKTGNLATAKKELLASPELSGFLGQNKDCDITMDQLADGSFRLLSSSGEFVVLEKNSPSHSLAKSFFDLCLSQQKNLAENRTDAVSLAA